MDLYTRVEGLPLFTMNYGEHTNCEVSIDRPNRSCSREGGREGKNTSKRKWIHIENMVSEAPSESVRG